MATRLAEDRLAAWRLLLETHSALTARLARELAAERDLALTWYDVLVRLSEAEGGRLRMQDLVGSLLLSKSGISRLVDRMEEAGLIARQSCPSDRRGQFAVLTDAGRATLRRAAPVHLRGIQDHFAAHLDDADVAALRQALGKIRAANPAPKPLPPCGD
ncbi:MAG: MarR family transcriptional regulator [Candidatus Dormibacteria bacterium]